ncbi:MAG TPA: hypothetical protein VGL13_08690, partial [Polyangiaceae bacterium]
GAFLGYPPASHPTWLLLTPAPDVVALAFDAFEAHVRVSRDITLGEDQGESTRHHVRGAVRAHHALRPLIQLASVLEAIARRVLADTSPKEQ